jgi:4-diphosphocytidyl-2-C-methyl-D-erythritol kinase
VKAILSKNPAKIAENLHNDLERVVLSAYEQVQQLRELFAAQTGVLGTIMSGSGPSVFAIVESEPQAELVKQMIRSAIPNPDLELFVTRTVKHGIKILSSKS